MDRIENTQNIKKPPTQRGSEPTPCWTYPYCLGVKAVFRGKVQSLQKKSMRRKFCKTLIVCTYLLLIFAENRSFWLEAQQLLILSSLRHLAGHLAGAHWASAGIAVDEALPRRHLLRLTWPAGCVGSLRVQAGVPVPSSAAPGHENSKIEFLSFLCRSCFDSCIWLSYCHHYCYHYYDYIQ